MARIYRKGRKLGIRALVARLLRHEYVFLGDKPMHPSFMGGMHFWTLNWQCRSGRIRAAVRNKRTS
jgi:hypothetical protein